LINIFKLEKRTIEIRVNWIRKTKRNLKIKRIRKIDGIRKFKGNIKIRITKKIRIWGARKLIKRENEKKCKTDKNWFN
jgi:hypothetical protein